VLIVRRMERADIPRVCEIEALCFPDPWSAESFESELSGLNPAVYVVAEEDGCVIGHMGMWHILDEGHITNVAVAPEARRQGAGRALVEESLRLGLENGLKAFTLEVRVSNEAALALYESFGFTRAGVRKRYYGDGEDALIMWAYKE